MLTYKIKAKPEEVFVFVYKFEKKKFRKEFPQIRVMYDDGGLRICHTEPKILKEADRMIHEWMNEFRVVIAPTNQNLDCAESFSELRRDYHIETISKESFILLLNDYEEAGLIRMSRHYLGLVEHLSAYQIIVAEAESRNKIMELLENLYGPVPKPSRKDDSAFLHSQSQKSFRYEPDEELPSSNMNLNNTISQIGEVQQRDEEFRQTPRRGRGGIRLRVKRDDIDKNSQAQRQSKGQREEDVQSVSSRNQKRAGRDAYFKNKTREERQKDKDQPQMTDQQRKARRKQYYRNKAREELDKKLERQHPEMTDQQRKKLRIQYYKNRDMQKKGRLANQNQDQEKPKHQGEGRPNNRNRQKKEPKQPNQKKQIETLLSPRSTKEPLEGPKGNLILAVESILVRDYDENDYMQFLRQGKYVKPSQVRINKNQDRVRIELLGQATDTEFIKNFLSYFEYDYLSIFPEQLKDIGIEEIENIKQQYPGHKVQYIEGWCPFDYPKQSKKLKELRNLIKTQNTKQNKGHEHPFFCLWYKGLHNIGMEIGREFHNRVFRQKPRNIRRRPDRIENEQAVKPTQIEIIKQIPKPIEVRRLPESKVAEIAYKKEQQKPMIDQWFIAPPKIIENQLEKDQVINMMHDQAKKQFNQLASDSVKLVQFLVLPNGMWCNVKIQQPNVNMRVAQMLRNSLSNMIGNKLASFQFEQGTSIDEIKKLPGIKPSDVFIEGPDRIIRFVTYDGEAVSRVHRAIEAAKQVKTIKIPNYIYASIEAPLKSYNSPGVKRIISKHAEQNIVTLSGLSNRVALEAKRIEDIMQLTKQKNTKKTERLILSVKLMQILRSQDLINKVEQTYMTKVLVNEININQRILILSKRKTFILTESLMQIDRLANYINILFTSKDVKNIAEQNIIQLQKNMFFSKKRTLYYAKKETLSQKNIQNIVPQLPSALCFLLSQGQNLVNFMTLLLNLLQTSGKITSVTIHIKNAKQYPQIEKVFNEIWMSKNNPNSTNTQRKWYWIEQNGTAVQYPEATSRRLNNSQKYGLKSIELTNQDLALVQNTAIYNKKTGTLLHSRSNQMIQIQKVEESAFDKLKFWKQKELSSKIRVNGKIYDIPATEMKKVVQAAVDQVPICLGLYLVDLTTMVQTNLLSTFKRKVHYVDPATTQVQQVPQFQSLKQLRIELQIKSATKENSLKCKAEIIKFFEKKRNIRKQIKLSSNDLGLLLRYCEERDVLAENVTVQGNYQIVDVCSFTQFDIEEIISLLRPKQKIVNEGDIYPKIWTKTVNFFDLVPVPKQSTEFLAVANNFKIAKISRLLRVQNKYIWKRYYEELRHLRQISGRPAKQMMLFHGTRTCDPSVVYADKQECFNINYSSERNLFGRGIYFAKEAAYSHSYAYSLGQNKYCMLYCRVLVGDSQVILAPTDQTRKMIDTEYRDTTNKIKFQSVKSNLNNSDIYVIYKSRRAYPEYVIEYE